MADPQFTTEVMAGLIEKALAEDGLSQAEFAHRAGVSPKHVNQVLRGHASTPVAKLDYWAFVLGRRFTVALVPSGSPAETGEDDT